MSLDHSSLFHHFGAAPGRKKAKSQPSISAEDFLRI